MQAGRSRITCHARPSVPPVPPVHVPLPHRAGYDVHFEPLARTPERMRDAGLAPGPVLVVTDTTVGGLYLDAVTAAFRDDGWTPHALAVPPGEASKSLLQYGAVVAWALGVGIERGTPVVALGGGVVGDLGGFAAATLLRGLPFVQLPTTTIAQIDSAVGGKTGVNTVAGKNLVGAFHAPAVVVADPATLQTLPEREYVSGLAEAVKHALLSDGPLRGLLDRDWDAVLRREMDVLPAVLREAVAVKAAVVAADEREQGARAFLNFGHTFAHALEREAGYGAVTHGEAVALGMRAALHLSASLAAGQALPPHGPLPVPFAEMDAFVARLPVPPLPAALSTDTLTAAMGLDKKRHAGRVRFVVLDGPGRPRLATDVGPAFVAAAWASVRT